jgi:hypothetical protein
MSREAMQMALEALESDPVSHAGLVNRKQAITALRQALETEQAMKDAIVGGTGVMLDGKRIDPATIYKEEPVAWANSSDLQNFDMKVRTGPDLHHTVPLYTAPPKQWAGLTDEEIDVIYEEHHNQYGECESPNFGYERAIEQALKEKNQ